MKNRVRNRGVRASRVKVTAAMTKAGLKTQAALAARIAEIEGLSDPPRQTVNKVLREQPVDMPTLTRIARALDVPVYSLYLTSQELSREVPSNGPATDVAAPTAEPQVSTDPTPETTKVGTSEPVDPVAPIPPRVARAWYRRKRLIGSVAILGMLLASAMLWGPWLSSYMSRDAPRGPLSVRMQGSSGDGAEDFQRHLLSQAPAAVTFSDGAARRPARPRDLVVSAELSRVGRAVHVQVFTLEGGERTPFWSAIRTGATATRELAEIAADAFERYRRDATVPAPENATVVEHVMRGLTHLDSSPNELNLRRAQSEFEAALRIDPRNATAQAALCETLVRQSWIRDEQRSLDDAGRVCVLARELDGDAPLTRIAHAHLLERTGRAAESHLLLDEILVRHPDNTDALLTGADTALQAFLETGERHFLDVAEQRARRSTIVEPSFWKTYWSLGRIEFHRGDVAAAIDAYEAARRLDANEYVLGNLGAMNFCSGNVERARDIFVEARRDKDNEALGEEYMGLIYFYLRDFAQSTRFRERALAAMQATGGPEIHQIWGDLGDSLRRSGRAKDATHAYERALQIVANDFAQGNGTAGDKAYQAYYRLALKQAIGQRADAEERLELIKELDAAAKATPDPAGLLRAALAFHWLNDIERARAVAARASSTCRVYQTHPDLI